MRLTQGRQALAFEEVSTKIRAETALLRNAGFISSTAYFGADPQRNLQFARADAVLSA